MKKLIAVISIILMLLNLFGYNTLFQLEKSHIQHAWKQKLKIGVPTDELHHFKFSEKEWNNLNWTKPNREFKIENQYYDVVYKHFTSGSYLIKAVSDDQETALFQNLAELVLQSWNDTPTHKSPSKIWKLNISEQYLNSKAEFSLITNNEIKHNTAWHHYYDIQKLNTIWNPPQSSFRA